MSAGDSDLRAWLDAEITEAGRKADVAEADVVNAVGTPPPIGRLDIAVARLVALREVRDRLPSTAGGDGAADERGCWVEQYGGGANGMTPCRCGHAGIQHGDGVIYHPAPTAPDPCRFCPCSSYALWEATPDTAAAIAASTPAVSPDTIHQWRNEWASMPLTVRGDYQPGGHRGEDVWIAGKVNALLSGQTAGSEG